MKRSIAIALATLSLAACRPEAEKDLLVKGSIAHAAGKKILLAELPFSSTTRIVVDSVTLATDTGAFQLQTQQGQEGLYQVFVEGGPSFLLINDATVITLKADALQPERYRTEGSAATQAIQSLYTSFTPLRQRCLQTSARADSLIARKGNAQTDSLAMVAIAQKTAAQTELSDFLGAWVDKQGNATAAFVGMSMSQPFLPPSGWTKLYQQTADRFPRHAGLLLLKAKANAAPIQGTEWIGKKAPELILPDSSGKMVSLSQFKGRWLLLDVWASWCAPCRKQNPGLLAAYRQYNKRGLSILSISIDEDNQAWKTAMQKDTILWHSVSDPKGWKSPVATLLQVNGLPYNLLIDPQGTVQAANLADSTLLRTLAQRLK